MLKNVLRSKEVKKSLIGFLGFFLKADKKESEEILEMLCSSKKENLINIEIVDKGKLSAEEYPVKYENALHYSKEKKVYLLESRLFDSKDFMIDSHLLLINSDNLSIKNRVSTDVWSYAKDWELSK